MSKKDFSGLDLDSDFETRPFGNFSRDEDPKEVGRRRLENAAVIQLDRILAKGQVREDFDEREHLKLVATIKKHGQQQPIKVRWSEEDGLWVILQGERRYRAAKDAGLDEIECTIETKNLTEGGIIEVQLVENIHRKKLNPVEEAKSYQRLMDLRACSAQDVALDLEIAPTTVQRAVRLLTLPADILEEVASGVLTKSVIREVQKIKGPDAESKQRALIEKYKESGSLNEVTKRVQKQRGGSKAAPAKKKTQTVNGIKLQATSRKTLTKGDLAAALRVWIEELESDGRGKRAA